MANHLAIHSFAQSLMTFLQQSHGSATDLKLPEASFEVLSSSRFSSADVLPEGLVSLYLHRITVNNHLRSTRVGPPVGALGLDLHFLLTVWSTKAATEHTLMGWAMRELHYHAFLDGGSLSAEAEWAVDDTVTLFAADLGQEEMARIWEASHRGYRLSYPFIARVVRLGIEKPPGEPVVATRFTFGDELVEAAP